MEKRSEGKIKTLLLKEAQQRRQNRRQRVVKYFLLRDAEKHYIAREAMARGAGQSTLRNSGWNTRWSIPVPSQRIEAIRQEIEEQFAPYFYEILQGRHQAVKSGITISNDAKQPTDEVPDGSIYFRFKYDREILPLSNENNESQQNAYLAATNAVDVLNQTLRGGFGDFIQAIQAAKIPLYPYFHASEFNASDGGFTKQHKEGMKNFISDQRNKYNSGSIRLPDGKTQIRSKSFFKNHYARVTSGEELDMASHPALPKIFSNFDVPNIGTPTELQNAIAYKFKDGWTLDEQGLMGTLKGIINQKLKDHNIDENSSDPKVQGYITTYKHFYMGMFKDIGKWYRQFLKSGSFQPPVNTKSKTKTTKSTTTNDYTTEELKLTLSHMTVPLRGNHALESNQFMLKTSTHYYPNGWDSSPNNARTPMLTMPPVRSLPDGSVVYDRGNGNMGYDHLVLNWNDGLGQFVQQWGKKCVAWFDILSKGRVNRTISQSSEEAFSAIQNVLSNRTSAETLVEMLEKYPDWDSFKLNHLDKSFASELKTVNGAIKRIQKESDEQKQARSQFVVTQESLTQDVNRYGQYMLSLAQQGNIEGAVEVFDAINKNVSEAYSQGMLSWDEATVALKTMNDARRASQQAIKIPKNDPTRADNSVGGQTPNQLLSKIDKQGFDNLRRYGYQVAKMMDLVYALMTRSSKEVVNSRSDGTQETFFGHQYSGSSGKSSGGEIILSVRYAYNRPEISTDPKIIKMVRNEQRKRHIRAPSQLQRQTLWPEHADPTGRFTDPKDPSTEVGIMQPLPGHEKPVVTIVENIEYFLGQATGSRNFAKTITHGLPWNQMIDKMMTSFPDIAGQLGVVFEPMSANLQRLELSCKRAIDKVRQDIEVWYVNNDGEGMALSGGALDEEALGLGDEIEKPQAAEQAQDKTQPPPQPETIPAPEPDVVDDPNQPQTPQTPAPGAAPGIVPSTAIDPNVPENNPMPKPMPDINFVGKKRNQDRRLLRANARKLGSIEERLERAANKLDIIGEQIMADKIDLLLHKIHEEDS